MLEEELDTHDSQLSGRNAVDIDNGCMRNETAGREAVLKSLHKTVKDYGNHQVFYKQRHDQILMIRRRSPTSFSTIEIPPKCVQAYH